MKLLTVYLMWTQIRNTFKYDFSLLKMAKENNWSRRKENKASRFHNDIISSNAESLMFSRDCP